MKIAPLLRAELRYYEDQGYFDSETQILNPLFLRYFGDVAGLFLLIGIPLDPAQHAVILEGILDAWVALNPDQILTVSFSYHIG